MGSRLAAREAGWRPKTIPTSQERKRPMAKAF